MIFIIFIYTIVTYIPYWITNIIINIINTVNYHVAKGNLCEINRFYNSRYRFLDFRLNLFLENFDDHFIHIRPELSNELQIDR